MPTTMISIAQQFSQFPAGRYYSDGPYSGQKFREEVLAPALKSDGQVTIDLDGVLGYGSSFLEEAFGGLVREHGYRLASLKDKLVIRCSVKVYEKRIWQYIEEEDARRRH